MIKAFLQNIFTQNEKKKKIGFIRIYKAYAATYFCLKTYT